MLYNNSISHKNYFQACLKDYNDQLIEIGKGSVCLEGQSVDFINEFVPLLKLRSTAKIIKVIEGEECHSFVGKVYLSSKNRLQLVEVVESFITYKELDILQKVNIKGLISSVSAELKKYVPQEVEIFSISMEEVCFRVSRQYQLSRRLKLQIIDPIATKYITLNVYKQLQFSEDKTVCYAIIERCPADCKKALIDFLAPHLILFS